LKADDRNPQTGTKHLKHRLEVAVGMKIMVTLNLAMEANLANSSQGIIHDIVLDLRESVCEDNCDENSIVWLQYPLAMIIFKPYKYQFNPFPGLEPSLILIFPSKVSFNIHCPQKPKMTIHRQQYPLCTTYAFMHKARQLNALLSTSGQPRDVWWTHLPPMLPCHAVGAAKPYIC
jgi:hypothetical protein